MECTDASWPTRIVGLVTKLGRDILRLGLELERSRESGLISEAVSEGLGDAETFKIPLGS